jgi:hypothetical protein
MPLYSVFTNEYDADIVLLLKRRLKKQNTSEALALIDRLSGCSVSCDRCAEFDIENEAELSAYCSALAELICFDARYFEMAEMIRPLRFETAVKRRILENAVEYTKYSVNPDGLGEALKICFEENRRMNLEGFIRFRLRDRHEIWRAAVDAAIDDALSVSEYSELLNLLDLLSALDGSLTAVSVILNPDTSCTIMNGAYSGEDGSKRRVRIDCAPGNDEGTLAVLRSMDAKRIALIDLSLGACDELKERILELFDVE